MGLIGMLALCTLGRPFRVGGLGFILVYFHFWLSGTSSLHWFSVFLISVWNFFVGSVCSMKKLFVMKSFIFES